MTAPTPILQSYNPTVIKFVDDTTVVGQITNGNESAYRDEVDRLTGWCTENNLTLNVKKTKEIIVDFRRQKANPQPLIINGEEVERTSCFTVFHSCLHCL